MDKGGIYEDGTPQQIFDDPQRENTRRFIRKLKVLELDIESKDYDFPAIVAAIGQYCSKNQIPSRSSQYLHLVFEELVQNQILPILESPKIHFSAEYSPANETIAVTVLYNGKPCDVTTEGDKLSLAVLRSAVSEMKWIREENEEFQNKIELKIKQTTGD